MNNGHKTTKIAIIGAGFSGTALVAALHRLNTTPCEITLYEKTGRFGAGEAYRTPFPFHLLNVRARDMSAFEDEPNHYVEWLQRNAETAAYISHETPLSDQFTPRIFYGAYLKQLLEDIQQSNSNMTLRLESTEVIDIQTKKGCTRLRLKDGRESIVDKVVFALGNYVADEFPFPVADDMKCIRNSWDYLAPTHIPKDAPVMIVGTGLSMIDTVQTLYHTGHRGKIYAVSRHGLLPLLHSDNTSSFDFQPAEDAIDVRALTKYLRNTSSVHIDAGGDWRTVMNAVRAHVPGMWSRINIRNKKRFMRHLAPYWNVHRHRVHTGVADTLNALFVSKQLTIIAGQVQSVDKNIATVRQRKTGELLELPVAWLINCMGPANNLKTVRQPLLQAMIKRKTISIDELGLGFDIDESGALKAANGAVSNAFFTIGPSRKGIVWEAGAVPEIRKQSFDLAKHLLGQS